LPDFPRPTLSALVIDVHKDWDAFRIENVGAPTAVGHVLRRGDEALIDHNALLNYVGRQHQPVGGIYDFNLETLTADKTLTVDTDPIYQYLDPTTANRVVTLSTNGARVGDRFIIRHNGAFDNPYYLEVQQAGVILDRIFSGCVKEFIFDGINWVSRGIGTGEDDTKRVQVGIGDRANPYSYGVAVGFNARGFINGVAVGYSSWGSSNGVAVGYGTYGYTYGVAVGRSASGYSHGVGIGYFADGSYHGVGIGREADGHNYGVAVGRDSKGYNYGVAVGVGALAYDSGVGVGYYARGYNCGVAVGHGANSGGLRYSIGMGYYGRCTRTSETAVNIDGNTSYLRQVTQGRWYGRTTDETPTEIFCGGISGERFTIRPKSAVAFKGLIVASTEALVGAPNVTKAWKVEGLMKRDADGVTSIVGTISVTIIAEDVDATPWSVTVDADDVNEALRITVTGAPATVIDWAVRMDCVEVVWS